MLLICCYNNPLVSCMTHLAGCCFSTVNHYCLVFFVSCPSREVLTLSTFNVTSILIFFYPPKILMHRLVCWKNRHQKNAHTSSSLLRKVNRRHIRPHSLVASMHLASTKITKFCIQTARWTNLKRN